MAQKSLADMQRELSIVDESMREFSEFQAYRVNYGLQWEEAASIGMPSERNTFFFGNYNYPGVKKTQLQIDSTVMLANRKFAAILDSMLTPFSSSWHALEASNPYVQKDRRVRLWLEALSHTISALRYEPMAAFRPNNSAIYSYIGAFGNGPMFIDRMTDARGNPTRFTRYKAVPVGQVFIGENHQGVVDRFCRWFRMTAWQAKCQFGDNIPDTLKAALEKSSEAPFDFLHRVCPNKYQDPERKDHLGQPFASYYINLNTRTLLEEGGYRVFPMAYARYNRVPDGPYAYGPLMDMLPSAKTLNSQKTTFLKQGHRAADPVLLGADDGTIGFSLRPGAYNPGTMSEDGKRLVDILPTNPIQITREMMEFEMAGINEAFLTTIFSSLVENPNMTATQVVELINQKGIFLAPMAGSMAPEYLGPLIEREIDLAIDAYPQILDSMPPLLREARGDYKIVYTSPLFLAARAGDAAGFLRTVESALQVAGQMNDPSVLDPFNFEEAFPAIARIQSVPESWMRDPETIAKRAQARAQAQDQQNKINAMPAQAAMVKAQAAVQKAGGRINNEPLPQ